MRIKISDCAQSDYARIIEVESVEIEKDKIRIGDTSYFTGDYTHDIALKLLEDGCADLSHFRKCENAEKNSNMPENTETTNLQSHDEKHIVEGCITLMQDLFNHFIKYMEDMGFEYDKTDENEVPFFSYTYFEIVQLLLLAHTNHADNTSTSEKCEQLGFDSYEDVEFTEGYNSNYKM